MVVVRRLSLALLALGAAILLAGLGVGAFLGYFGGPVYRLVPATATATATAPLRERDVAIVFLSGDSGFNTGMAPKVMAALAARGVPVLGVNSLTAFARRRTPAQARALVVDATRRALRLPGVRRVVLMGQSFGADMLQFAAADMPAALRPRIAAVLLAVPGDTLLFRATPGGLFDGAPDRPALPSARRIDWAPLLCIHGTHEADSLCPSLHGRNVRIATLPGDHYLRHDAATLASALWHAVRQVADDGHRRPPPAKMTKP